MRLLRHGRTWPPRKSSRLPGYAKAWVIAGLVMAGPVIAGCSNNQAGSSDSAHDAAVTVASAVATDAASATTTPATDAATPPALDGQPRALPAPPLLTPRDANTVRAALAGTWVSDTGIESINWKISSSGAVAERVFRRGHTKGPPLRSRRFTFSAKRKGELESQGNTPPRRYSFLLHKRKLYASYRYGVFPRPTANRFSVSADGIGIRYDSGTCTGTQIGGAKINVRCKYVKSGPLEVFTARYQLPNRPRPTMTVFHKVGKHLVHETMLSCCEFKRR